MVVKSPLTIVDTRPTIGGGPVSITIDTAGLATIAHGRKQWQCVAEKLCEGDVTTHPHFTSPVPWVEHAEPIPSQVLCRAVAMAVRWGDRRLVKSAASQEMARTVTVHDVTAALVSVFSTNSGNHESRKELALRLIQAGNDQRPLAELLFSALGDS
jgi:hypothetical protein